MTASLKNLVHGLFVAPEGTELLDIVNPVNGRVVELAHDVRYALASSGGTRDPGAAVRVSRDLDFGAVWINTLILLTAEMPYGGFTYSGYGKDLSMRGVEGDTRVTHVMTSLD